MRCFGGLQLIFLLSLTQCITVSSLPQGQGFSRPTPTSVENLASELLSAASAFQSSTVANGNGGGSSNTQATATGSSVGTGTGTGASTATRTSNASAGQSTATGTATGTAAADRTGTAGAASVTGSASNSQGTAGTASGATATTNSSGATTASNSASPANTGGASSNDDPDSTSGGGGSTGDGSSDAGDGGGSGSGSAADTQNKGSSNGGLSRGELAAVVILPILAAFAIFFLLFRYYRQIRERFNDWRATRNERGAYRRALDDPVGIFAIKHRRHSTGLSLPDMQSIMRPLSFGFSHPQRQTIKRKPLNYDASRINDGGFSSIGMAIPNSTTERNGEGGGDGEAGHQRNESEVSALTHATANANGAAIVGGRPRTDSSSSSFSSVSSTSSQEESTGFVDARTSQRASQITS
ncbi:hypothetical protein LTR84_004608 [Exophiala bonariae]|uniref:REJ domain-containing protein n=1 Tax=Exophiala bonariae TaxID=1690606 RepID=A0AAV9NRH0_9EURO|nr:hypothetical protein LTR84_004608 [Exophiala bonariae]